MEAQKQRLAGFGLDVTTAAKKSPRPKPRSGKKSEATATSKEGKSVTGIRKGGLMT